MLDQLIVKHKLRFENCSIHYIALLPRMFLLTHDRETVPGFSCHWHITTMFQWWSQKFTSHSATLLKYTMQSNDQQTILKIYKKQHIKSYKHDGVITDKYLVNDHHCHCLSGSARQWH